MIHGQFSGAGVAGLENYPEHEEIDHHHEQGMTYRPKGAQKLAGVLFGQFALGEGPDEAPVPPEKSDESFGRIPVEIWRQNR